MTLILFITKDNYYLLNNKKVSLYLFHLYFKNRIFNEYKKLKTFIYKSCKNLIKGKNTFKK